MYSTFFLFGKDTLIGISGVPSIAQAPTTVCADNPVALDAYSNAARESGRPLDVMIECDTGQKRAGVETPGEALALAQIINLRVRRTRSEAMPRE